MGLHDPNLNLIHTLLLPIQGVSVSTATQSVPGLPQGQTAVENQSCVHDEPDRALIKRQALPAPFIEMRLWDCSVHDGIDLAAHRGADCGGTAGCC
jgi:hypothetical protein